MALVGSRLGGTVDQDGKSNVWAVEPTMKVEKTDKGLMAFAPVAAVAAIAVLAVPLLPLLFASNPDQVCRVQLTTALALFIVCCRRCVFQISFVQV